MQRHASECGAAGQVGALAVELLPKSCWTKNLLQDLLAPGEPSRLRKFVVARAVRRAQAENAWLSARDCGIDRKPVPVPVLPVQCSVYVMPDLMGHAGGVGLWGRPRFRPRCRQASSPAGAAGGRALMRPGRAATGLRQMRSGGGGMHAGECIDRGGEGK